MFRTLLGLLFPALLAPASSRSQPTPSSSERLADLTFGRITRSTMTDLVNTIAAQNPGKSAVIQEVFDATLKTPTEQLMRTIIPRFAAVYDRTMSQSEIERAIAVNEKIELLENTGIKPGDLDFMENPADQELFKKLDEAQAEVELFINETYQRLFQGPMRRFQDLLRAAQVRV